jgi:hypothetical protein
VTTKCSKKHDGIGEVTVNNFFGVSVDYIAAEYTDSSGNQICDKSKCVPPRCGVAVIWQHCWSCLLCHVFCVPIECTCQAIINMAWSCLQIHTEHGLLCRSNCGDRDQAFTFKATCAA